MTAQQLVRKHLPLTLKPARNERRLVPFNAHEMPATYLSEVKTVARNRGWYWITFSNRGIQFEYRGDWAPSHVN